MRRQNIDGVSLKDINYKLSSNKLNISFEEREIKSAEDLLSHFRRSLEQQNKDLNIFVEKKDLLEKQICKYLHYERKEECNKDQQRIVGVKEKIISKQINLKRKIRNILDSDDEINDMGPFMTDKSLAESIVETTSPKNEISLEQMDIPNLKDVFVISIIARDYCGILLGGSNGFLMHYNNNNEAHIYKTYTKENIVQIEIIKYLRRLAVIAITEDRIIVFKDITDQKVFRKFPLIGIKFVYNQGSLLYITLNSGYIKMINSASWVVSDYNNGHYSKDCLFFPNTIISSFFLLNLKDNLLYKSKEKDFSNVTLVEGIDSVRMVLKVKKFGHICYSNHVIGILNKTGEVSRVIKFTSKIKIVKCTRFHLVVVDFEDIIHAYKLRRPCYCGEKILEKEVTGLTSIALTEVMVYVVVKNVIFILKLE